MWNGHQNNSSSSSQKVCEVGLGLKMPSSTPYYNYQHLLSNGINTTTPNNNVNFPGTGGGPMLSGGIYEAAPAPAAASDTCSVLPVTTFSRPTGAGGGGVYGKPTFTASQLQELERQKIIFKHFLSNITVPPHLLLPTPFPPVTQSTTTTPGLELRYPSNGSDLEPWRCKRTDGKKWRCSRDVAPHQKYCERHAHKSKARSRKPVELSPHKFINAAKTTTPLQATFQRPAAFFPTMVSAATTTPYNDQTRRAEGLMRCGANNQQQWQQQGYQTSSAANALDFSRHNNTDLQRVQYEEDKQPDYAGFNNEEEPYIPYMNFGDAALEANTRKTRLFIDAWENEGADNKGKKISPSSSLSLSMSAGNAFDDEEFNFNGYWGIGTTSNGMNMNPVSWLNNDSSTTFGGPLGEVMCLGNASPYRGHSNLPSTNNNNSSCSKSSGEDGSHALNFIG